MGKGEGGLLALTHRGPGGGWDFRRDPSSLKPPAQPGALLELQPRQSTRNRPPPLWPARRVGGSTGLSGRDREHHAR